MHEQEFERSVQQKLEDLSFTPSAPVWENVATEIRRRRKKRRVMFWILPLGLVGAALLFYLLWPEYAQWAQDAKPLTAASRPSTSAVTGTTEPRPTQKQQATTVQEVVPSGGVQSPFVPAEKNTTRQAAPKVVSKATYVSRFSHHIIAATMGTTDLATASAALHTCSTSALALFPAFRSDNLSTVMRAMNPIVLMKGTVRINNKKHWLWSLQLQYGRSAMTNGRFLAPVSQDFSSAPPGSVQNGTGVPAFTVAPLKAAAGPFTSVTVGLRKKLGRHWHLQPGLQYALYTQKVGVGNQVNMPNRSNTQDFFEPGRGNSYRNQFHQAALPLLVQYQPFSRGALELEAGIAPGLLLAARTLRYDTAARLFTEHKPVLRYFQVPVVGGIRYRVGQSRKMEWLAGVQVQYHLTSMYNRNNASRLYSVAAGIQVRSR